MVNKKQNLWRIIEQDQVHFLFIFFSICQCFYIWVKTVVLGQIKNHELSNAIFREECLRPICLKIEFSWKDFGVIVFDYFQCVNYMQFSKLAPRFEIHFLFIKQCFVSMANWNFSWLDYFSCTFWKWWSNQLIAVFQGQNEMKIKTQIGLWKKKLTWSALFACFYILY